MSLHVRDAEAFHAHAARSFGRLWGGAAARMALVSCNALQFEPLGLLGEVTVASLVVVMMIQQRDDCSRLQAQLLRKACDKGIGGDIPMTGLVMRAYLAAMIPDGKAPNTFAASSASAAVALTNNATLQEDGDLGNCVA